MDDLPSPVAWTPPVDVDDDEGHRHRRTTIVGGGETTGPWSAAIDEYAARVEDSQRDAFLAGKRPQGPAMAEASNRAHHRQMLQQAAIGSPPGAPVKSSRDCSSSAIMAIFSRADAPGRLQNDIGRSGGADGVATGSLRQDNSHTIIRNLPPNSGDPSSETAGGIAAVKADECEYSEGDGDSLWQSADIEPRDLFGETSSDLEHNADEHPYVHGDLGSLNPVVVDGELPLSSAVPTRSRDTVPSQPARSSAFGIPTGDSGREGNAPMIDRGASEATNNTDDDEHTEDTDAIRAVVRQMPVRDPVTGFSFDAARGPDMIRAGQFWAVYDEGRIPKTLVMSYSLAIPYIAPAAGSRTKNNCSGLYAMLLGAC